jgi:hypothetical protein
MLPSAETVEKMSYGDPIFRMPTQSNIPITADREYLADVVGMIPFGAPAARPTARGIQDLLRQIQTEPPTGAISPEIAARVLPETKVVDEAGNPRLLYHGTNKDYEQFSESMLGRKTGNPTSKLGYFFSGSPSEASRYAADWGKEGGNVRPVYLDIKNPKRLTYKEMNDISMALFDDSSSLPVNAWKTKEGQQAIAESREKGEKKANQMAVDLRERLISDGYDGAVVRIGGQDEYIAFSPEQIRSATSDPQMAGLLDQPAQSVVEAPKFEIPSFAALRPETEGDIDQIYDFVEQQAKKAGYRVKSGASNISGSRYLTITEDLPDDDIRDIELRISDHGDRHPFSDATEGKISIDPSRGGTDLEAALYELQEKGFNLLR